MKLIKIFRALSVALATIGLLVPNVVVGAETQPAQVKKAALIIDVSLIDGSSLQGQVVNPQGRALANTAVSIRQGQNEVAKATTDKNGEFSVKGLKGGVYVVSTTGATGVVRAWAPRTAPPSAVKGVLLVTQSNSVLAQDGEEDGLFGGLGVGALVVLGIAGVVIAVAADHNTAS